MGSAFRPRLRLVVAVWLLFYAAAGVAATGAALVGDCTCPAGMGLGQICPMHHSGASTARCRLTRAQDSSTVLLSVIAVAGLLPDSPIKDDRLVPLSQIDGVSTIPIERPDTPDFPPPRRA